MLHNPKNLQNNSNLAVYNFQAEESKEQMFLTVVFYKTSYRPKIKVKKIHFY